MRARLRVLTGLVAVILAAGLVEPQMTNEFAEATATTGVRPTDATRPVDRDPNGAPSRGRGPERGRPVSVRWLRGH